MNKKCNMKNIMRVYRRLKAKVFSQAMLFQMSLTQNPDYYEVRGGCHNSLSISQLSQIV